MKNVLIPLAKSILIPLGLEAAAPATDASFQKKNYGSGMTTLIILNEEMDDILKIVQYPKEVGLSLKLINWTIENKAKKKQKHVFLVIFLGTLATNLLANILEGKEVTQAGERTIKVGQDFQCHLIF